MIVDDELMSWLPGEGWLSLPEARLLAATAEKTVGDVLEVGGYRGRSTALLALLLATAPGRGGCVAHSVDPYLDGFDDHWSGDETLAAFWANMTKRGIANVRQHRQRIEDWEPRPVGLAYLDGDHTFSGTKAQIGKALLCKPAWVGIHDVNDDGDGKLIKQATVEMLGPWAERVERLAVWKMP